MKQLDLAILNPLEDVAVVVPLDPKVHEELLSFMTTAIVTAYIELEQVNKRDSE